MKHLTWNRVSSKVVHAQHQPLDWPRRSRRRRVQAGWFATLLEPGMCLTVEPGLYFGAWRPDVDCPERYANIGIRIEDDVLITAEGPVVLTADCPKTIDDIERIVGTDPQ